MLYKWFKFWKIVVFSLAAVTFAVAGFEFLTHVPTGTALATVAVMHILLKVNIGIGLTFMGFIVWGLQAMCKKPS